MVADGTLSARARRPTVATDAEALFTSLTDAVDTTRARHRAAGGAAPTAIGVGCAGPMSADRSAVSPLNIGVWRDFPLRDRLSERYGLPCFVDIDTKALALAEGWRGAAVGVSDYVAMVVSTGIGGGLVLGDRLVDGASGNAGHVGHIVVVPEGRECSCGSHGCVEAEASGTAIAAITGRSPREADLAMRRRTGMLVGRAVATLVVACDIRLACIGGAVALGFGDDFFTAANAELEEVARIGFARGAKIVPAGLGDDGPLVGAACVAVRDLGASA